MGVIIKQTSGLRISNIAARRGIPVLTVETIIKDYLNSLSESLMRGERVVLDGLTSITVVRDQVTGEYTARGRVSPALKSRLQNRRTSDESDS